MRAVMVNRHGGPETLKAVDVSDPQPTAGQLLVRVTAAGVNFSDVYAREGRPPYAVDLPYRPGSEGAGVVTEVGPGVTGFSVGDEVAWAGVPGSYAEQVLVPAERAVPVPSGIGLPTAAAVMLQGLTAHYLSHSICPLREGDVAVVHAAAGGVGLLLTQMLRMRGVVVVATTSTEAKAERARQAGADHVTGYDNFTTVAREVSGGTGAAVVYDAVGRATFDDSLVALRPRGYLVLYGVASGPVPLFDLDRLGSGGSLFLTRPTLAHYIATRDELLQRASDLFAWIAEGKLTVHIGGSYSLAEAARAHEDLQARRTTGKLLLLPG